MNAQEQQVIISEVREGDYDRFLAIQLAPPAARAGLYAVTAFHVELARIAELVSEPLIGHIRLAWWREALEEIEQGKPARNHPVVLALATLHTAQPEILPWLLKAAHARAVDIDTSLITHEAAWLEYCDHTAGALHMAWALLLKVDAAHYETIQKHARAYAMIGLVRAIPFMYQQGWLRFPHARMNAAGITTLERGDGVIALSKAVMEEAMRNLTPKMRVTKPLDALSGLGRHYYNQLKNNDFNPYLVRPSKLACVWCVMKHRFT